MRIRSLNKMRKSHNVLVTIAEYVRANLATEDKKDDNINEFLKSFQTQERDNIHGRDILYGRTQEVVDTEDVEKKRQELRELEEKKLSDIESKMRQLEAEIQMFQTEILQLKGQYQKILETINDLGNKHKEKIETFELLSNPEENEKKLIELIEKRKNDLKKISLQWEEQRKPLIQEYRQIRDSFSKRDDVVSQKLTEIKQMRISIESKEAEIVKKESQFKQLADIFKQLPKEKRSSYTSRNLEMLKNVKKYTAEINKILTDTKTIQSEINSLTETLGRSFSLVDDMIYTDAKKDQLAAEAYKLVVSINKKFKEITETISSTGSITNSAWSLEDKIEKLTERTNSLDMTTLLNDLQQVKEENTQLIDQVKNIKAKKKE